MLRSGGWILEERKGGRMGKEREKMETARSEIKGHGIEIKGRGGKGT